MAEYLIAPTMPADSPIATAWPKETRGKAGYMDFSSGYFTGPEAALKRGMIEEFGFCWDDLEVYK